MTRTPRIIRRIVGPQSWRALLLHFLSGVPLPPNRRKVQILLDPRVKQPSLGTTLPRTDAQSILAHLSGSAQMAKMKSSINCMPMRMLEIFGDVSNLSVGTPEMK